MDRTNHYYPFGLEFGGDLNINNTISPAYRYSTQGQEKQTETGWSSYRWRNYDAAMGRFFNIDPLSEKYTYQSHYNFSENRVVDARELEGLERISIHTASYAPFDSFGGPLPTLTYYGNHWGFRVQGPFAGDGADRKPGTNPNASSKIYGRVDLDLGANSAKDALVNVVARGSHSKDLSSGETTLSEASLTVSLVKDENQVNLDMHLSGNNDLVTLSPDIDVKPSMTITTTSLSNGNKMLHIKGTVSGDHFPANETYITGQNGQGVSLGNSGPLGGKIKEPTASLPGDNNRPMSQFNKIIYLDKDNNITQPPKNGNMKIINFYLLLILAIFLNCSNGSSKSISYYIPNQHKGIIIIIFEEKIKKESSNFNIPKNGILYSPYLRNKGILKNKFFYTENQNIIKEIEDYDYQKYNNKLIDGQTYVFDFFDGKFSVKSKDKYNKTSNSSADMKMLNWIYFTIGDNIKERATLRQEANKVIDSLQKELNK
ncbi:hypothetical protein OWR28_03150 [Chryseobacterium sp. 1B4]